MDFDKPKVYGDTFISDGLVSTEGALKRPLASDDHPTLSNPLHSIQHFLLFNALVGTIWLWEYQDDLW